MSNEVVNCKHSIKLYYLNRYTAIAVLEMDFERLDINQCPKGEGNKGPNHFADTARCKKETTECEPLNGWGFRRGGYQCRCKPGYRLPNVVRRPYLGEIIERASAEQYYNDYDCLKIGCELAYKETTKPMDINLFYFAPFYFQGCKKYPYNGRRHPIMCVRNI